MEINFSIKNKLKYILSIFVLLILFIAMPKTYAAGDPTGFEWVEWYGHIDGTVGVVSRNQITNKVSISIISGGGVDFQHEDDYSNGNYDFDMVIHYMWFAPGYDPKTGDRVIWNANEKYWMYDIEYHYPVLTGQAVWITNFDNPITSIEIISKVKAWDNEDGDISHLIEVDQDGWYEIYNRILNNDYTYSYDGETYFINVFDGEELYNSGSYIAIYVSDSSGNTSYMDIIVYVKDVQSPVISGTKTYNVSSKNKMNVNDILSNLTITDNTDAVVQANQIATKNKSENIYPPKIRVLEDNYTPNFNKLGTYQIKVVAEDFSGNVSEEFVITINVLDTEPPVFTAPENIIKQASKVLLISDILKDVSVNDLHDPNVSFTVKSDGYTGNGHKKGIYQIVLEATDASGNTATHTINIQVMDDIPPVFYVDQFFIHVDDVIHLTRQDIIDLLIASGQLQMSGTTTFTFTLNEYEGNENIPGIYGIIVKATSTSGTSKQVSLAVQVHSTEDNGDIVVEEPQSFFKTIWNGINKIWNWLFTTTKDDGNFYNVYYILIVLAVLVGIGILTKKPRRRYHR